MTTRQRLTYFFAIAGSAIILINLYVILMRLGDEVAQGAVYRIIFFHVPAAFTAWIGFFAALVASAMYLWKRNFAYDAFAVSAIEVGFVFATVNLVTGSIWARNQWGIWWTWDARLTSMFVCWLLYAAYLVMRGAIEDASQRATLSAVLAIFAFADVPIVYLSIYWWRTQHPSPVLTSGGLAPELWPPLLWNFGGLLLIATSLVLVRLGHEDIKREIESARRYAHAL